jgi:hypothetical protein
VGGLAGIGCGGCPHEIHRIGELNEAVSLGEVLVGESAVDRISRSMLWITPATSWPSTSGRFASIHVRVPSMNLRRYDRSPRPARRRRPAPGRAEDPRARCAAAALSQR